mmetsp:Transcript_32679/g.67032  ORF Transcript_32679/g.67032 Transcript_32679/m.67032 type:complete len:598 (+) Transcript_32679:55-1848(+)
MKSSPQIHSHHRQTCLEMIISLLLIHVSAAYFTPRPIYSHLNVALFHQTAFQTTSPPKNWNSPLADLRSVNLLFSSNSDRCTSSDETSQKNNDDDTKNKDIESENDSNDRPSSKIALGAWVPIGPQAALTGLGPTRLKVMNIDLVVWDYDDSSTCEKKKKQKETKRQWSVMRDVCSHKFAALSQGRVNRDTNCIECPYHGWQFDPDGTLVLIPQMEDDESIIDSGDENGSNHKKTMSSKLQLKGSVQSYTTHTTGDLIWAFLPASIHGESFPINLLPEEYYCNGLTRDMDVDANFAMVDLPASYDFFMENGMDPSHFSFAHHGVIAKRKDAGPLPMEILPSNFTHVSFRTSYKRKGEFRERIYGIQRPFSLFTLEKDQSKGNFAPGALIFFVPIEEGRVRFLSSIGNNKLSKFRFLPVWVKHLLTLKLIEGDTILHDAERTTRLTPHKNNSTSKSENYLTPTSADKGVIAFRTWWRKYGLADSPPHTFGPASPSNLKNIPRWEYTNPWMMHTKSCANCRAVLRKAKWLERWGGMGGLFFGWLFMAGSYAGRDAVRLYGSLVMTLVGLGLSLMGRKIIYGLEGGSRLSDIPDRAIPLD